MRIHKVHEMDSPVPLLSQLPGTTETDMRRLMTWYDQPDEPYLRPVSDRIPGTTGFYCDPSPRFSWTQSFDAAGLQAVMEKYLASYTNAPRTNLGRITGVEEQGRTESGRLRAIAVHTERGTYTIKGNDIRFVLRDPKGTILNSTFFTLNALTSDG